MRGRDLNITFDGGIARQQSASERSPTKPYDLHNARVNSGVVSALRTAGADDAIAVGKPWVRWSQVADVWITGHLSSGKHANRLYTVDDDTSGTLKCGKISKYYNGTNEVITEPAAIYDIQFTQDRAVGTLIPPHTGITTLKHVTYLCIPFDKDGEAGAWFYAGYRNNSVSSISVRLEITTNANADKVRVYRTLERNDTGFSTFGAGDAETVPSLDANVFYLLGEASKEDLLVLEATHYFDGSCVPTDPAPSPLDKVYIKSDMYFTLIGATIHSTRHFLGLPIPYKILDQGEDACGKWIQLDVDLSAYYGTAPDEIVCNGTIATLTTDPDAWERYVVTYMQGSTPVRWRIGDDLKLNLDTASFTGFPLQGQEAATNVHSLYEDTGPTDLKYAGFSAQAMHNDAGTMIYGNVCWTTERPQISFLRKHPTLGKNVKLQYEYINAKGEKVYGPVLTIDQATFIDVAQGRNEIALMVYVDTDPSPSYRLFERLTPNGVGRYVSGKLVIPDYEGLGYNNNTTFNFNLFTDDDLTSTVVQDVTDTVSEPHVALLSGTQTPYNVTFDNFQVEADETILAISSARVAEEESVRSYSFYVLTDKRAYVGLRQSRTVALDILINHSGVALGTDGQPLVSPAMQGLIFVGTNGHVYFAGGRQVIPIDVEIIETGGKESFLNLWATVYDITYHPNLDETWLATDTGIWCIDMSRAMGVIAQYDLSVTSEHPKRLLYSEDRVIVGDTTVDQSVGTTTKVDGTGTYLADPYVQTQPLFDGSKRMRIDRLEATFDQMPVDRDSGATYEVATVDIEVRSLNGATAPSQAIAKLEPSIPVHPFIRGGGQQVTITEFKELRELNIQMAGSPGNN